MKRIKSKKDIPWFNIDNYKYLDELDEDSLKREVYNHLHLYHELSHEKVILTDDRLIRGWKSILVGEPNLACWYKELSKINPIKAPIDDAYFAASYSIQPLDIFTATYSVDKLIQMGHVCLRKGTGEKLDVANWTSEGQSLAGVMQSYNRALNKMLCSIDLEGYSDAEIISDLKRLLPHYRQALNTPEPITRPVKGAALLKIKSYRVIPLIDLTTWEISTRSKISRRLLSEIVFPNNERYEEDFIAQKGVISIFLNRVLSPSFIFSRE